MKTPLTAEAFRLVKIVLITALPLEMIALYLLWGVPLDIEPKIPPGPIAIQAGRIAVILHFPALWLLTTPLSKPLYLLKPAIPIALFAIGYLDLLIVLSGVFAAYRWSRRLLRSTEAKKVG